ncbi:Tyrosine recombinase XerC (plasmid) [Actinosynnema sp. ALI-1.44]
MTALEGRAADGNDPPLPVVVLDDATLELFTGPDRKVPDWLWFAFDETRKWLTLDYLDPEEYDPRAPDQMPALSHNTTKNYAVDLGLPRALHTWRPPPGTRGRKSPGPIPQSWLRFCASFDINPFTDVDEDIVKVWLRFARGCGDARTTLRRRTGALGAWYGRMRRARHTTIVFDDVLTRATRRRHHLHIKKPVHPTTPATLPQARALQVAAWLDPGPHAERNQVIAELLPTTGLRAEELCGLDLNHLHRKGPGGVPGFYVHGKGGDPDWVAIPPRALELIDAYLKVRVPPPTGRGVARPGEFGNRAAVAQPLLTSRTGHRLTTTTIRDVLEYLCGVLDPDDPRPLVAEAAAELAGLALHPHQFRHFQAQTAEDEGATWSQIGKTLRQASAETTKIYLESGGDLRNATPVLVERALLDGLALDDLTVTDAHRPSRTMPEQENA